MDILLNISERGQITIPANIRKNWGTNKIQLIFKDQTATLTPLQTKDEFLKELDQIEKEYKKNGGLTLKQMQKKHDL